MKSVLGLVALSLASADPLACQPNEEQPMLPIYHIIGNVTKNADGSIKLEAINDCSGVTYYEGLYHVWHQCCQNHWDHMISKDLIHWQRLPPPVQPLNLKTWDGSVTMLPKEDGGPLMLYDAQDGKLMEDGQLGSGDNPVIGVARLADLNDKYLLNWTRAENNPVEIKGGDPIAFPGQVWKNGDHWNFLGQGARFQSNDNTFHTWTRMDDMIGSREHGGQWWVPMPNAIDGSSPPAGFPNRLVNVAGGEKYRFGHYYPENETFVPYAPEGGPIKEANLEGGTAGWWGGQMANNRMMIIGWATPDYHNKEVPAGPGIDFLTRLTLLREVNYDAKTQSLVSNPLPEFKRLRNSSLANERGIALKPNAMHKIKGTESGAASSADIAVTFSGIVDFEPVSFGACVLGNATEGLGISITVSPSAGGSERVASVQVGTCGDTMYKQNKVPGCDKWEADWDLPGGDYEVNHSSVLTGDCTADSCACQSRCRADGPQKCKAWTLVPGQKCCLKGSVPHARSSPGMFSGVEDPDTLPASGGASMQTIQLFDEEKVTLRITPDRSLADFFVQGGRWAGTVAWPKDGFAPRKPTDSQVALWSSSRGVNADINVWGMGCGWADPSYTEHPTMLDDELII